jgi:predicted SnoaL-like aldol condensation-catalyzing enzyme
MLMLATAAAGCGPDLIQRTIAKEEHNKQVVAEFHELALNRKDAAAAAAHLGSRYVQHSPELADGVEGFQAFIEQYRKKFPDARSEIKRVFADGDYVVLHVHAVPAPQARGQAMVDIYRLAEGRIVEHWGVIQDVPEKSANPNGMF